MKQIDLREGARRQHRAVALYAIVQSWVQGLDAIVFRRNQLLRLLGLDRFKETRVDWLQEDLRELFPHQEIYVSAESKSLGSLLASRKPFVDSAGNLTKRLESCAANGIVIGDLKLWSEPTSIHGAPTPEVLRPFCGYSVNSDERLLTAYLSLLAAGQISPLEIPEIRPA